MKRNIKKLAVFVMMAAIALFLVAATVSADDRHKEKAIHGDYAFTGTVHCVWSSPPDFDSDNLTWKSPFSQTSVIHGVYTFNRDGTGSFQARAVALTTPPTSITLVNPIRPASAAVSNVEASITYTVGPDDTVTINLGPGGATGTVLNLTTGEPTGLKYTVDQYELKGMISENKMSLTLASDWPQPETYTALPAPPPPYPRVCYRSQVLLRLQEDKEH